LDAEDPMERGVPAGTIVSTSVGVPVEASVIASGAVGEAGVGVEPGAVGVPEAEVGVAAAAIGDPGVAAEVGVAAVVIGEPGVEAEVGVAAVTGAVVEPRAPGAEIAIGVAPMAGAEMEVGVAPIAGAESEVGDAAVAGAIGVSGSAGLTGAFTSGERVGASVKIDAVGGNVVFSVITSGSPLQQKSTTFSPVE
jgi:collagen type VII alpha